MTDNELLQELVNQMEYVQEIKTLLAWLVGLMLVFFLGHFFPFRHGS